MVRLYKKWKQGETAWLAQSKGNKSFRAAPMQIFVIDIAKLGVFQYMLH